MSRLRYWVSVLRETSSASSQSTVHSARDRFPGGGVDPGAAALVGLHGVGVVCGRLLGGEAGDGAEGSVVFPVADAPAFAVFLYPGHLSSRQTFDGHMDALCTQEGKRFRACPQDADQRERGRPRAGCTACAPPSAMPLRSASENRRCLPMIVHGIARRPALRRSQLSFTDNISAACAGVYSMVVRSSRHGVGEPGDSCAARKVIAARHAACLYSLMSPPRIRVRSGLRVLRSCTAAGCS
ncbi:hypothetical protein SAMN04488564_11554 [Lentzea waywayandensis]|uniref:Uncharacterized protein n=1 Tax=Lentzea waywayandensis TaxID=84724 RepID=A0A1I6FFM4_9PSEU|nr:hypothetical protein SAMN04488564_11554 [Lentzea waywayandensis]